jgi:hypothetical protein
MTQKKHSKTEAKMLKFTFKRSFLVLIPIFCTIVDNLTYKE